MNLEQKKNFLVNLIYFFTISFIIFVLFKVLFVYLLPFVIGSIIAYIVQKPSNAIATRFKLKKEICATVIAVLFYLIFYIAFILLIWLLVSKTNSFINFLTSISDVFEDLFKNINTHISKIHSKFGANFKLTFQRVIGNTADSFTQKLALTFSNIVTSIIKNTPNLFLSAIITVVASCYMAKDYDKLILFFKGILNEKVYKNFLTIKNIFTKSIFKIFFGYLKITLITFIQLFLGLVLLKIEHFLIISIIISIIDLLPIIGTGAVLLPWAVISFLQNNYKIGIGLVLIYLIICIVRNFLEPKIIGEQIGINPIFILISIFLGLKLAGIVGVFIFPITLIVVFTFYRNKFAT